MLNTKKAELVKIILDKSRASPVDCYSSPVSTPTTP